MFPGNRLLPQTARVNYPEIAASLIVKNGRFCVSLGVARLKVTCTDAQVTRTGELKLREGVGTTRDREQRSNHNDKETKARSCKMRSTDCSPVYTQLTCKF